MAVTYEAVSEVGPPAMSSGTTVAFNVRHTENTLCFTELRQQAKAFFQISLQSQETTCTQEQTSAYSNYFAISLGLDLSKPTCDLILAKQALNVHFVKHCTAHGKGNQIFPFSQLYRPKQRLARKKKSN